MLGNEELSTYVERKHLVVKLLCDVLLRRESLHTGIPYDYIESAKLFDGFLEQTRYFRRFAHVGLDSYCLKPISYYAEIEEL
jgi:hypothetical protein